MNAIRTQERTTLPSGNLPMRDIFAHLPPNGTMHLKSVCGNVERSLHPQYAGRYPNAPVGAWWALETRRDSSGQEWTKQDHNEYFVVDDFGNLVSATARKGGAA